MVAWWYDGVVVCGSMVVCVVEWWLSAVVCVVALWCDSVW